MKSSKEIAEAVFQVRDAYVEQKRLANKRIKKVARISTIVCVFTMTIVGAGYWNTVQHRLPFVQRDTPTKETMNSESPNTKETNPAVADPQTETQIIPSEIQTEMSEEPTPSPPITETIPPTSESIAEQTTEESVEVPQWDEKEIAEQFMQFTADGNSYSSRCSEIANESIGEKLYDAVVSGFDDYADEIRYADAAVYRINDISTECAVAVRFQGYNTGYVYTNQNYFPETLGELMDALHLKETLSFHALTPAQGESITEFDRGLLIDLLNDHRELARTEDDSFHKRLFSVSTNVELLGITNKAMTVTEDGWLTMNIMEWGYAFHIGERWCIWTESML